MAANVRSGSIAEVGNHVRDVRFTPESGSRETPVPCPLCANKRHRRYLKYAQTCAKDAWTDNFVAADIEKTAKCPRLIQIKGLGTGLRHFGNIG